MSAFVSPFRALRDFFGQGSHRHFIFTDRQFLLLGILSFMICVKFLQHNFNLSVLGVTYTIIARCLHEGEDIIVQHFAAKTIENVASTHGRHCYKFGTNDTAQVRTE